MEEYTEDTQKDTRTTPKLARKIALMAWEVRGWVVDRDSLRQLSKTKVIGQAQYFGKHYVLVSDVYGGMLLFTKEECRLLGLKSLVDWPE